MRSANCSLKVLHVIPSVAAVRGGPSHAVIEMVAALRRQDVQAEIATTNENGTETLDVPLYRKVNYSGVPTYFFPRFSPPVHAIREFAFSGTFTQWLWRHAKRYDIIHIHAIFSYTSTVAIAIARHQNIPYVVRPLGQLCAWSLQQSALKKSVYLYLIERANLNKSRALHLTSEQEKREVETLGLTCPSLVVPHGICLSDPILDARKRLREKFQLPSNELIILFLSRIHPKKGLSYLISALNKLEQYPFTFILAGSGKPEHEALVQSLINQSGIRNRIISTGFVGGEAKALLLQGSDLFTLTSHSENFGVAVLEALVAGLPTLVTPGIALSKEIQKYQLGCITKLDSESIASTLKYLLEHPDSRKQMGHRAKRFALEKYTWKKNAESLKHIYTDILNGDSRAELAQASYTAGSNLQRSS